MKKSFYFLKVAATLSIIFTMFTILGCKSKLLPSTNVAATKENKAIVAFMESYKIAMEKRSVDAVMELVATDFSDNSGSEDPKKRLNYIELKEKLEKYFPTILDLRIGLFVQNIEKLDKERYNVTFYFNQQSLVATPDNVKEWVSINEVSRMSIRKRNDRLPPFNFEIVSGI